MTVPDHPQQIGKFPVVRRLGVGAMGEVFLCIQPELERQVAVKVMRGGAAQWPRFQREARSAARLVHPHVVRVYDVGLDHESPYIVMEYVDGRPLSELIGTNYLTISVVLRLLYHITEALDAAHLQSIVHRDLKPSNILIDSQGRPRLTDFGLAKSLLHDVTLSGSGDLVGTPRYMAPEQILGDIEELDQRVDIFAMGVVMYEMLAGRPPFDGANVVQILRQVTDDDPAELRSLNPTIPVEVDAIVRKAMSKRPDDRFSTASDLGAALRSVLLSGSLSTADNDLRSNDYLTAFVPAPTVAIESWLARTTTNRPLAGLFAAVFISLILFVGWWFTGTSQTVSENSAPDTENYDLAKAVFLQDVEVARRGAMSVPEPKTPREVLKESLDDATALLKRDPDDDDVRLGRARLLRRAGECLAADAECTRILVRQPDLIEAHVERLMARSQLWGLYLGGWEERLLRYPVADLLKEDIAVLENSGDPVLRHYATLTGCLGKGSSGNLMTLVQSLPIESHELISIADIAAVNVELLFRAAEAADTSRPDDKNSSADKDPAADTTLPPAGDDQPVFGILAAAAQRQLRSGLASDPYHVGLLFLRAASFSRRIGWDDANGGEDRSAAMKRGLFQFEAAIERLLRVTLRLGCDTSIARAVILTNMGWSLSATEQQLQDALSCRPTVPQLQSVRTWLRLRSPEDGTHSRESLNRLLSEFRGKHVDESDEFTASAVEAVLLAGLGRFGETRRPLRVCRRKQLQSTGWLALDDIYQHWIDASQASDTSLLFATREIISQLPIGTEVVLQLHSELLQRLGDDELLKAEGHSATEIRDYRARTQFSLAEIHAGLDDQNKVLEHVRLALEQHSTEVTPDMCRDHWAFANWKDDAAFVELYRK